MKKSSEKPKKKKAKVSIVDKKSTIIFPDLLKNERRVPNSPSEIIISSDDSFFDLNFRLSDIVIDSIAKKYPNSQNLEEYPDEDDDENRFLIGVHACRDLRPTMDCPYMEKVSRSIEEQLQSEEIIAIHLIDSDDSDEDINRQQFVILTKSNLYHRDDSLSLEKYDYDEIRISNDGIENVNWTSSEGRLLDYVFDRSFVLFAQEFMLLRKTTLADVGRRHPFADEFKGYRLAYLELLAEFAAAEGNLTAEKYIRLEYIAREFKISHRDLEMFLTRAYNGGIPKNEAQSKLLDMLTKKIHADEWYVFFQDALEAAYNRDESLEGDGFMNLGNLIDLMSRKSAAGYEFIEKYTYYMEMRFKSEKYLRKAIESIGYQKLAEDRAGYLSKIHELLSYDHELRQTMLDIMVLSGNIEIS